ncbi:MAG: hypothetical protein ABI456_16540 [Ktedonobacteraceae bacterium]|nr:hypothetical protein [Chloroflexota bacterium]
MSQTVEITPSFVIQAPVPTRACMLKSVPKIDNEPKVVINGDVRLQVTEPGAARKSVSGHYAIETAGLQSPLHVIWMIDGYVLRHSEHDIEVAFDMRGRSAGETLTRQLSVQVTEKAGQGCIMHSSVFVQIVVVDKAAILDGEQ